LSTWRIDQNTSGAKLLNKTHFTIIIPAYNCEKWAARNIESATKQVYNNYDIVYVDDCSTDNTLRVVNEVYKKTNKKFDIVSNKENKKALYNLYTNISKAKENTVIITLDGDDFLSNDTVLQYLDKLYRETDCWLTAGSYVQNDNYQVVSPNASDDYWNNNIRKMPWSFSHLRTFKKELFMKIKKQDLLDVDGDFYKCTFDRAMMYPMVEMAGKEKIQLISKVLYIYNRFNPISVDRVHRKNQLRIEAILNNKPQYERIPSLS